MTEQEQTEVLERLHALGIAAYRFSSLHSDRIGVYAGTVPLNGQGTYFFSTAAFEAWLVEQEVTA